jgi:hypothetical protein
MCAPGHGCDGGLDCCGNECCAAGQICCKDEGPVSQPYPHCFTPTADQMTCPDGCAPLCVSDRNLKSAITAVDPAAVLESVAQMPIATWSYTSDPASVRHMGPMAQDFHAAFGLGSTDRAYDPVDAHGVAFAAIQALYDRLRAQEERLDALERENARLRAGAGVCPAPGAAE